MKFYNGRDKQWYVNRIGLASKLELVVINYDLLLTCLRNAEDAETEDDGDAFGDALDRARSLLYDLMSSLDMKYEVSDGLSSIYIYINGLIVNARRTGDVSLIKEAGELLGGLKDSWERLLAQQSDADATVPSYGRFGNYETAANAAAKDFTV